MYYAFVGIAMLFSAAAAVLMLPATPSEDLSARLIMERTIEAAGGAAWTDAETLSLRGYGEFWPKGTEEGSYIADDYRMWRAFSGERTVAHGPDGWVRIESKRDGNMIFAIGFDGETTWTHQGIVPPDQAAKTWANNFGFGIIREALESGFSLVRKPDEMIDGHACYFVAIISPDGAETLFAMDKDDLAIRYVGFDTPRGWHERRYSDFVMLDNPKWRQARRVRLFYDGIKANEIYWEETQVNVPLDQDWFRYPGEK
ncbi:MAG: hypothetical protein ACFBZ9_11700 [Sphingomonadales bacterium]